MTADLHVYYVWVPTKINLADGPSARGLRATMRPKHSKARPRDTSQAAAKRWSMIVKPKTYMAAVKIFNQFMMQNANKVRDATLYDAMGDYFESFKCEGSERQAGNMKIAGIKHLFADASLPASAKIMKS